MTSDGGSNRREFLRRSTAAAAAGTVGGVGMFGSARGESPTAPSQIRHDDQFPDPMLRGPFAPVFDELDVADLKVEGSIPRQLRGLYLRNGPNPAFMPIGGYAFPFDGDGMLHGVYFADGKARYRNRFIRTRGFLAEQQRGKAIYGSLMKPFPLEADKLPPGADPGPIKHTANTHVVHHAGHFLCLWEGGLPYEVTRELDTVGQYDFGGKVPVSMTAHPKFDPKTGEMIFFRYGMQKPFVTQFTADAAGRIVSRRPIDVP
ncbi:MAG: carotenoid oxygenase family protein, partial [Planctomycetia bacterium]